MITAIDAGVLELARILSWLFWHFKQNVKQKYHQLSFDLLKNFLSIKTISYNLIFLRRQKIVADLLCCFYGVIKTLSLVLSCMAQE